MQGDGKDTSNGETKVVQLDKPLSLEERQLVVKHALATEDQDAENLLSNMRARMDRSAEEWQTSWITRCCCIIRLQAMQSAQIVSVSVRQLYWKLLQQAQCIMQRHMHCFHILVDSTPSDTTMQGWDPPPRHRSPL